MNEFAKREVTSFSSLEELQHALTQASRPLSPNELTNLFKQHNYSLTDLLPWIKFDSNSYCRNRVLISEHAELLIMCWRSGQLSPIHNHKGSACCIRVISGQATEIAYEPTDCGQLAPSGISRFKQGQVFAS
jgi:cysteine dioxygenase